MLKCGQINSGMASLSGTLTIGLDTRYKGNKLRKEESRLEKTNSLNLALWRDLTLVRQF